MMFVVVFTFINN